MRITPFLKTIARVTQNLLASQLCKFIQISIFAAQNASENTIFGSFRKISSRVLQKTERLSNRKWRFYTYWPSLFLPTPLTWRYRVVADHRRRRAPGQCVKANLETIGLPLQCKEGAWSSFVVHIMFPNGITARDLVLRPNHAAMCSHSTEYIVSMTKLGLITTSKKTKSHKTSLYWRTI